MIPIAKKCVGATQFSGNGLLGFSRYFRDLNLLKVEPIIAQTANGGPQEACNTGHC